MSTPRKTALRDTLVSNLLEAIQEGAYPIGHALPSVRALAKSHGVSPYTAAAAYNALAAAGWVSARQGSGYFVCGHVQNTSPPAASAPADALWERRIEAPGNRIRVDAGGGWLPTDWQYLSGVAAALRSVAREPSHSEGYGSPNGFELLRAYFARQLKTRGVSANTSRIVLTQGASQGLDLVVRTLLEAGDTAVVEDPTYPPTLELLRARGVHIIPIPRLTTGPDTEALHHVLQQHRIRALFTNTSLQNPTGTSTSVETAKQLIELARANSFMVVEDDIFSELSSDPVTPLVAFDDGSHVLYVSSISKTISPTLRVGFVLAGAATLAPIIRLKTLSALASSELSERIAYAALTQPQYRHHLTKLRKRLTDSQTRVQATLLSHGVELAYQPVGGMFLWGKIRSRHTVGKIWQNAVDTGVLLAPGESFRPDGRASPWWRFNVTQCEDKSLSRFIGSMNANR
jgi:aspartate/methionine/tyrosine aminotransferase